jgi:hypothetical protein
MATEIEGIVKQLSQTAAGTTFGSVSLLNGTTAYEDGVKRSAFSMQLGADNTGKESSIILTIPNVEPIEIFLGKTIDVSSTEAARASQNTVNYALKRITSAEAEVGAPIRIYPPRASHFPSRGRCRVCPSACLHSCMPCRTIRLSWLISRHSAYLAGRSMGADGLQSFPELHVSRERMFQLRPVDALFAVKLLVGQFKYHHGLFSAEGRNARLLAKQKNIFGMP